MTWFYFRDHAIVGPVTESEITSLASGGVIQDDTLVWEETGRAWRPWGVVRSTPSSQWTPEQWTSRNFTTPVGAGWVAAWGWFGREPWALLGYVTVWALLSGVVWLVSLGLNLLIPVLGGLLSLLLNTPVQVGILLLLVERYRGQPLQWATLFRAFGPRFGQLVLGQLVQSVAYLVVGLPALVGLGAMFFVALMVHRDPEALPLGLGLGILLTGAAVGLAGVCAYFYLVVAWLFAPLLIVDKGMDFWPAMQLSRRVANRHPWRFSWYLLVATTLMMLGILFLGVGVLVTLTLGLMMLAVAYERLYGTLRPANLLAGAPPVISPTIPTGNAAPSPADPGSNPPPGY